MRTLDQAGVITKLLRRCHGTTQEQVALDIGVQASFLSNVIAGRRKPSSKILAALGLRKIIRYQPTNGS